jgi:sulfotransferase family protein
VESRAGCRVTTKETGAEGEPRFFVGIGAQKAGTSWLAEYFSGHPEVYFSPIKELHFFDALHVPECKGWNTRMERRLEKVLGRRLHHQHSRPATRDAEEMYRSLLLRVAMPLDHRLYREYFTDYHDGKKAFGEISPSYALLPRSGFQHIVELFPSAHFIFLLRNPVDRFWSSLRFKFRDDVTVDIHAKFDKELDDPRLTSRTAYQDTLETLFDACDPARIKTVFYEDMFGPRAAEVVKGITDFLDISFTEPDFETKVNEGPAREPLSREMRIQAARKFSATYEYAAEKFNTQIPQRWLDDMMLI